MDVLVLMCVFVCLCALMRACACVPMCMCGLLCSSLIQGYEGSFLKLISSKPGKPPQPIAFVSFTSRSLAERALEELQVLCTVSIECGGWCTPVLPS